MFKCQHGYTLQKIKGIHYLLPYGQQIADQKKGMVLNDTSASLWNIIQHTGETDAQTLAEIFARQYKIKKENFNELFNDVNDFLNQMLYLGALTEDLHVLSNTSPVSIQIAGLHIRLYGPREFFSEYFKDFYTSSNFESDQEIEFITTPPYSHDYGQVLLRNSDMTIFENTDRYVVLFPQMNNIYEVQMTLDGTYVRFYCSSVITETACQNIFHAIRLFYLFVAQQHGKFAIHSASVLYKGKAWLFSGHSGMGKSTHTRLWHELLKTPYLNGDLNLLGTENGKLMAYGIPWCGTSEIYTNQNYELGGIVLLDRDPAKDFLKDLTLSEKIIRVMQRMISPSWKENLLFMNLEFAEEIVEHTPVFYLFCTKNPSAVHTIQKAIDQLEVLQ